MKGYVTDDYCNIYFTNDGGLNWVQNSLPAYYSSGINALKFINLQIGYLTAGNSVGSVNYGYIYKTIDSGTTWTLQKDVGGRTISFTPDSVVVISGAAGSIITSKVTDYTVLPVKLTYINASYTDQGPVISWKIMSDLTSNYFMIESSTDGITFSNVGKVKAQQVFAEMYYHFVDTVSIQESTSTLFYRIKIIDLDGTADYSKVLKVDVPRMNLKLFISPNPANNNTIIHITQSLNNPLVSIFDVQGRKVYSDHVSGLQNVYNLSTRTSPSDICYISIWKIVCDRDVLYTSFFPSTMPEKNIWHKTALTHQNNRAEFAKEMSGHKYQHLCCLQDSMSELFVKGTFPYSVTSWIAHEHLYKHSGFDLIIYPSFTTSNIHCNLAFHPNFADNFLRMKKFIKFKLRK